MRQGNPPPSNQMPAEELNGRAVKKQITFLAFWKSGLPVDGVRGLRGQDHGVETRSSGTPGSEQKKEMINYARSLPGVLGSSKSYASSLPICPIFLPVFSLVPFMAWFPSTRSVRATTHHQWTMTRTIFSHG